MSWFAQGSRLAGVAAAALLIALTPAADASQARLNAVHPYWVAHGRLIAFTGSARLWTMNADGSGRRRLDGDVVSPSGRHLASSWDTGTAGFVVTGPLTGRATREFTIRVASGEFYGPVTWAPDDDALAIEVLTTSRPLIFVADLRKALLRLVSRIRSRADQSPDWSPDGGRIAFITCTTDTSRCDLAVMARNGSNRKLIAGKIDALGDSIQPLWAPNGRAIALALRFGDTRPSRTDPAPQRYGIYVVRPNGSGFQRIAATPYMTSAGIALAWSPDSRRIAFADTRGITVVRVSDGAQERLTALGRESTVSWAPSARVLFSNQGNLYTARPGERPLRVLP